MSVGHSFDVAVVGGGALGASIAYHLVRRGRRVVILDRGPAGFLASFGTFGLVWVQGKTPPAYLAFGMRSARLYPDLAADLRVASAIDIEHEQPGGLHLCLSEEEMEGRQAHMEEQARTPGFEYEMLDAAAVRRLEPHVGPDVVGAAFCPLDGDVNPLALIRAFHRAVVRLGGHIEHGCEVRDVRPGRGGWIVDADCGIVEAGSVVLAAGLGLPRLARSLGLDVPVRPQLGQLLVTERLPRLLHYPSVPIRQTRVGSILMGTSHDEVGFDKRTTRGGMSHIAAAATRYFPVLRRARVIRAWGCLRPLTPDNLPIFEQPRDHPGLFLVTSHSGIGLAPAIGRAFSDWIIGEARPSWLPQYDRQRFLDAAGVPDGSYPRRPTEHIVERANDR